MTEVAEQHYLDRAKLPPERLMGVAVARHGYGRPSRRIEMIEAGRPCLEIAQQLQAVESAIANAKRTLIEDHMEHCIGDGVATDVEGGRRQGLDTLFITGGLAAEHLGRRTVVVSGGVAANRALRDAFAQTGLHVVFPGKGLNTDNGAMIAFAGAMRLAERQAVGAFNVKPRWPLDAISGPSA